MKNFIFPFATILFLIPLSQSATAQWAVGASYEIRNEDPTNGFGLRLEKSLLEGMPIFDLSVRGHFSYFNDTNNIRVGEGVRISRDMDVYDYGLAAVAGFKLGFVRPFAGAGIGRERYKQSTERVEFNFSENNFYWNAFGGAEFTLLPVLNPFIEYRYSKFTSVDELDFRDYSRVAIGINVRF